MTNIQNKIDQRPIAADASVGLMPKVLKNKINFSNETINEIIAFVNTGELDQAEQLALDLTASHPKKGIGWKILGTIYQKQAKNEQSVHALKNALKTLPQDFEVHFNYANAHFDLKNYDIAKRHYQAALKISPNFISAHFNLGSLYQEQNELSLAIKHFVKVTQLNNSHVEAYLKLASIYSSQKEPERSIAELQRVAALGVANAAIYTSLAIEFSTIGKSDQSKEYFEKALLIEPDNALNTHIDYAVFLKSAGKLDEAISVINHALNNNLEDFDLYNTLGLIYLQQERLADAEYCFKKTIVLNPKNELGYINYGLMKLNQGQLVDAEAYCMKGLELCPDNKVALNNLALIFNHQGRYDDAISTFEKVIAIDDTYITALSNISTPLRRYGRFSEAEEYLKKAFAIDSKNYDLHVNLASIYQGMGLIDKAIEYNWKAIKINPDKLISYENLLFDTSYTKAYALEYVKDKLDLYGETLTRVAKHQFNNWHSKPDTKRLKVGFVSADFIIHPVSTFLKNILENLNLTHFELVAYSNNKFEDVMTQTLKAYFRAWHCIVGMSDYEVAQLIHDEAIDILIDLSGHTGGNRLGAFAYKPAPVQVTWLGYWASTGVTQMDYILLDEMSAPITFQNQFTEKIKYLPETRFCYSPPSFDVPLSPLPALENPYITFGCYHTYAKVSDEALAVWAKVMAKLPNSILRWQTAAFKDEKLVNQVHQKMQKFNISTDRVLLSPSKPYKEYFNTYDQVDFVLDSFPFTACTTTSDALWMGVPTLTIAGNRLVERQGASLMNAVGLPEWIAKDEDEFIEKAVSFAGNVQYLSEVRETLREKLLNSTLGDGKKYAQNFEQALWEIWQEKKPQNTQVSVLENTKKTQYSFVISSATRMSEQEFWETSALGLSIKSQMQQGAALKVNVAFNNALGLSEVYNAQIHQAEDDAILIFMHDDVWIDQRNLLEEVEAGLEQFDVIGVAGNKRNAPNQPAWAFIDTNFTWDKKEHLSGKIGHGKSAFGEVSIYGPMPAECELLDGVFLAAKKQTLIEKNVYFDPQFDFHFYDLDFCRTARSAGLTLGTWDIALTHQSGGAFGSERWQQKYQLYLNKWERPVITNTESETALDVEAIYQSALQYQQNGHDKEAVQLYQQLLRINSEHADAIHNLGYIEFTTLGVDAALIRFEKAVMLQPQNEQFWVSYIDALMELEALETAQSAIAHGQKYGLTVETAKILANELSEKTQLKSANHQPDIKAGLTVASALSEAIMYEDDHFPDAWLKAYPQALMIEYTSRCNLRCKYCPKSNPGEDQVPGRNMDMTAQTIDAVIHLIKQYQYKELLLAGTGESTFHPDWLVDFPKMIAAGKQTNPDCYVHLNSNFAIKYEDEHLEVLAQLDGIVISIDTADRQLTKEVRAKSDLGLIIYNIVRFKAFCDARGLALPKLTINVTLYEAAAAGLPELMHLLSSLPIAMVSISDLYEGRAALQNGISPIHFKTKEPFEKVIQHINEASNIANALGRFKFGIQPHLVERLNQIISGLNNQDGLKNHRVTESPTKTAPDVPTQQTKFCLQPWTRFTLAADASIFPCCVTDMDPVGTINEGGDKESLNSTQLIQFRKDLLTGNIPSICLNCTNAALSTTTALQQAVHQLSNA